MTPYTAYLDIQGIIYEDEMNRNRLMRTNELHNFSDGTLNHVCTALNDIPIGLEMDYLPKRKWSNRLAKRSFSVMIQCIDKQAPVYRRLMLKNWKILLVEDLTEETYGCWKGPYDLSYDILIYYVKPRT
ncbi:hypothetical protein Tco_1412205 [Tanacetum coccineum]